jgi:hypothetical protein
MLGMSFRDPVVVTRVVRLVRPSLIALVTLQYDQVTAHNPFIVECTRPVGRAAACPAYRAAANCRMNMNMQRELHCAGGAAHSAGVGAALLRAGRLHAAARHGRPLGRQVAQLSAAAVGRSMGMGLWSGKPLSCSLEGLAVTILDFMATQGRQSPAASGPPSPYCAQWLGGLPGRIPACGSLKAGTAAAAGRVSRRQVHCICCAQDVMHICLQDISGAGPTAARGQAEGQPGGRVKADSNGSGSGTGSADAMAAAAAAPSPA